MLLSFQISPSQEEVIMQETRISILEVVDLAEEVADQIMVVDLILVEKDLCTNYVTKLAMWWWVVGIGMIKILCVNLGPFGLFKWGLLQISPWQTQ